MRRNLRDIIKYSKIGLDLAALKWAYFPHKISDGKFSKSLNIDISQINQLQSYFRERNTPQFFYSIQEKEAIIGRIDDDSKKYVIQKAEQFCEHYFDIFGTKVYLGKEIDWHYAFHKGKSWPQQYVKKIDCRGEKRIADVKWVWELNRFSHFVTLGKAYWYTDNEKYAKEFVSQINSWIEQNPLNIGVNWDNALEVSIRSILWIMGYFFFLHSPSFDARIHIEFLKSLVINARFVLQNLSTGGFNHLIGEAAGLSLIGILFPEFREAEQWRSKGIEILSQEIERQFYEDGGHIEQALAYHRFVLDFYLLVYIISIKNKIELEKSLIDRIEKGVKFLSYLRKPDSTFPLFGDNDDAILIPFDINSTSFETTIAIGSSIFCRPEFKFSNNGAEALLWLLDVEAFNNFLSTTSTHVHSSSIFLKNSGHFVMRSQYPEVYLRFDCGKQGVGRSPHGHADALSFELFAFGNDIFTDRGTYTYNGLTRWRNYFKGTRAHNTVAVDDQNQADITGTFSWSNLPNIKVNRYFSDSNYDFIDASHDGYTRLAQPVIHRRQMLFCKPDYIIIQDLIEGKGKHKIDILFHTLQKAIIQFDYGIIIEVNDKQVIALMNVDKELNLSFENSWTSSRYGKKKKILMLNYSTTAKLPVKYIFTVAFAQKSQDLNQRLKKIYKTSMKELNRFVE